MQLKAVLLLAVAVSSATAVKFLGPPANASASPVTAKTYTAADVAKLRAKMETIATALAGMLDTKQKGSLADAQVAPAMRSFVMELRATLNATAAPKDVQAAMRRLKSAQAGVAGLTKALNQQQESLMRDDTTEEVNLMLGVLMTRRGEPVEKQLEVLRSPDFVNLPVSKALLVKHDSKTPLFEQVAAYMDAHGEAANTTSADVKGQKLAKTIAYFGQRAGEMEKEDNLMQKMHERRTAEIDALIKKSKGTSAHRMELEKKHMDREFKKKSLVHMQQTKVMKEVVSALKRGDSKALKKAQDALKANLKAMEARTGNFLHLIQLEHRLASRDCPFCVAQCIGKCHDAGSPYALCMTQCATAGQ